MPAFRNLAGDTLCVSVSHPEPFYTTLSPGMKFLGFTLTVKKVSAGKARVHAGGSTLVKALRRASRARFFILKFIVALFTQISDKVINRFPEW